MYRLVEEHKHIQSSNSNSNSSDHISRQHKLNHFSLSQHPTIILQRRNKNNINQYFPFDEAETEMEMDQQQQQQRISMRSSFIEGRQHQQQETGGEESSSSLNHKKIAEQQMQRHSLLSKPNSEQQQQHQPFNHNNSNNKGDSLAKHSMPLYETKNMASKISVEQSSGSHNNNNNNKNIKKIITNNSNRHSIIKKKNSPSTPTYNPSTALITKATSPDHTNRKQRQSFQTTTTTTTTNNNTNNRKAHPWKTDVKLNRFGDMNNDSNSSSNGNNNRTFNSVVASSSTQKTTMTFKQRMQARKAVFGTVAVTEEQYLEEEDNDDDSSRNRSSYINSATTTTTTVMNRSQRSLLRQCNSTTYHPHENRCFKNNNDEEQELHGQEDESDDEEAIREEAVKLLQAKGFYFRGILQQQYSDDLESVGPNGTAGASQVSELTTASDSHEYQNSTATRQVLRLDDIQNLRRKIMLQQQSERKNSDDDDDNRNQLETDIEDNNSINNKRELRRAKNTSSAAPSFASLKSMQNTHTEASFADDDDDDDNDDDDDDEPYDQASSPESVARRIVLVQQQQKQQNQRLPPLPPIPPVVNTDTDAPAPDDDSDYAKAWRVMKELRVRLRQVFTEDHRIIEAMGRKGQEGVVATSHKIVIDTQAFERHKLRDAVQQRVSQLYTGDHVVVVNGETVQAADREEKKDDDDNFNDNMEAGNGDNKSEVDTPVSSGKLKERLSGSFQKFEAMLKARQQESIAIGKNGSDLEEDDDWTECSATPMEPTVRNAVGMIPSSLAQPNDDNNDDDQTCWTEYTLETNTPASEQLSESQNPANSTSEIKKQSGCQDDDVRATIKMNNEQRVNLKSILSGHIATSPTIGNDDDDDETYAEYTVHEETVEETIVEAPNPFRLPGEAPLQVKVGNHQDRDDQSYMEMTVLDDDGEDLKEVRSPQQHDEESYMEVTVQAPLVATMADSPPTRLPFQQLAAGGDESDNSNNDDGDYDQHSYEEITVQESAAPGNLQKSHQSNDLTSPHMANMLSSRMFADMDLPSALKQQQPQQVTMDQENNDSFPTITVGHFDADDDDDMTQLTFDHTMADDNEQSEMGFLHDHSNKTVMPANHGGSAVPLNDPSVVDSQHTEQTRDTTCSDDLSTSQHDGASFKSCVSTESSHLVAELLRRDVWSPDPAVVHTALETLGREASLGINNRSYIVRYGGLLAILRAMELKPDHADVQTSACFALEKMAEDPKTQVAICEVGGMKAIAQAMERHAESCEVQRSACTALSHLTRHSDEDHEGSLSSLDKSVPAVGVVRAMTDSMKLYPEDPTIQSHSFITLANICLDNQDRLRELKLIGGLATMTTALQVPWENKTDQHEAISTLSILLRSSADLGHQILLKGS